MELTKEEQEVINLTVELWNKIVNLPIIHSMDNQETCTNIHDIQNRIFARALRRNTIKIHKSFNDNKTT